MEPILSSWRHVAILLIASAAPLWATKPQRVVIDSYDDFAQGTSLTTSIGDTGVLSPAPAVQKLADIDAGQIWCILPEPDGHFLVGTSPHGALFRVDSSGKSALVTSFSETHIYAMARSPKGDVFVATSPDGKIFKLVPNGKPVVYFEPKEKYIWSLLFDRNGVLYAGTGTQGRIYRITGEGTGSIYYNSDETHIRSLAWDSDGKLLAGTGDNGLLLRVAGEGEAIVLASTGRQEVNQIAVAPTGIIYFSATGGPSKISSAHAPQNKMPSGPTPSGPPPSIPLRGAFTDNQEEESKHMPGSQNPPGGNKPPAPSPNSGTLIFRIDRSLFPAPLWESKDTVLTLQYGDNQLYAGTNTEGYCYTIGDRGETTRLLRVEGDMISAAAPIGDKQWIFATSNPARVFKIGGHRDSGVYQSDVIDSELFARWGSVSVKATGSVQLRTRSGNTPKPDKTWYPWAALKDGHSQSPPARYLQIELEIAGGFVDRLDLVYLNKNLPPEMDEVEVLPAGSGYVPIASPPSPAPPKTADQLLSSVGKETDNIFHMPTRFQLSKSRGLRTIVWKASDPNDDDLRYTVYYRFDTDDKNSWRVLADDLKEPVLSWDSSGWPDGNYYFKVEATDATDNAPGEELKDSLVSKMVIVDNTPPRIVIDSIAGGFVNFTVSDEASGLLSIMTSRNGKDFFILRPLSGILDSKTEQFRTNLAAGEVLFIRAEDESGNVSSAAAKGK